VLNTDIFLLACLINQSKSICVALYVAYKVWPN